MPYYSNEARYQILDVEPYVIVGGNDWQSCGKCVAARLRARVGASGAPVSVA